MPEIPNTVLARFKTITLEEIAKVSLMDRVDTKFVFHRNKLNAILEKASNDYQILQVAGTLLSSYKNLYFDTDDFLFYRDHHNGKRNRTKVRMRKYVESDLCYLEVKRKNNKGRIDKKRERITDFEAMPLPDTLTVPFLQHQVLKPALWNEFKRITLVNLINTERVTLDIELTYTKGKSTTRHENLVIAELKQPAFNRASPIFKLFGAEDVNPLRVSKYCLGLAALETVKKNAFKQKIRKINSLTA